MTDQPQEDRERAKRDRARSDEARWRVAESGAEDEAEAQTTDEAPVPTGQGPFGKRDETTEK